MTQTHILNLFRLKPSTLVLILVLSFIAYQAKSTPDDEECFAHVESESFLGEELNILNESNRYYGKHATGHSTNYFIGPIQPIYLVEYDPNTNSHSNSSNFNLFPLSGDCAVTGVNTPPTIAPCINGSMGGSVFIDANADGEDNDGSGGADLSGIEVHIFGCLEDGTSGLIETVLTDANGDYSFTDPSIVDGEDYRIEFTNIPAGFSPSHTGIDNASDVQYTDAISCDVNYGIIDPALFCQANPIIATPCFVNGLPTGNRDAFVSFPYTSSGIGKNGITTLATNNQVGSTVGLAYARNAKKFYLGAFLKRHVGLVEGLPGNPLGRVFVKDMNGANATSTGGVSQFINLEDYGANVGTIGTNSARGLAGLNDPSHDDDAYTKVGKVGLGDIDISADERFLYVVSLNDKKLFKIEIDADGNPSTAPALADVTSIDIPAPGCVNGEWRPFGLKVYQGGIYIGGVCDGSAISTAAGPADVNTDMRFYVYKFDESDLASPHEVVMDEDLDYPKGSAYQVGELTVDQWFSWLDVASSYSYAHPQPILSDIEFDGSGSMILGFMDRYANQRGQQNYQYNSNEIRGEVVSAGDILKASLSNSGMYILENNASVGGMTGSKPNNNQGPGGGEFFDDNFLRANGQAAHSEISYGLLAMHPTNQHIIVNALDPVNIGGGSDQQYFRAGGPRWLSNVNGSFVRGFHLYQDPNPSTPAIGKSQGLGDLELMCDPAPLQIGNYAWIDTNGDGVQDPCEDPLSGLIVKLYTKPASGNAQLVATTTTSATGEYYFTDNTTVGETWESGFTEVEAGDYFVVFCGDSFNAASGLIDVGGDVYVLSNPNIGMGSNTDMNDSDVESTNVPGIGNLPAICISVVGSEFSFDAGFVNKPVVEIIDIDISCGPVAEGGSLFLTVNGGMAPFTYDWSNDDYDGMTNILNVPVGVYSVTVTDGAMCTSEATAEITEEPCAPNPCANGELGGTVFNDINVDGVDDGSSENGPQGVRVQIFGCTTNGDSELIETVYTDPNGDYHFTSPLIVDGENYRIEFSSIPEEFTSSIEGADNGTETQYVDAISCDVDYGIFNPSLFCEEDPMVAVACYIAGDPLTNANAAATDAIVSINHNYLQSTVIAQQYVDISHDAIGSEVGSTWGLSWNPKLKELFTAAFLKRHVGVGPDGIGAIYTTDYGVANTPTSLLVDLAPCASVDLGTISTNSARGLGNPGTASVDAEAYAKIGKVGYGDIDLSEDFNTLYAVNLNERNIVILDMTSYNSSGQNPTCADVTELAIPHPTCTGGVSRPFALKVVGDLLYVGVTCTSENGGTRNDLNATVLAYDVIAGTWSTELSIPLNYTKGSASGGICTNFNPWLDNVNTNIPSHSGNGSANSPLAICRPAPLLSDIEFDSEDGSMILAIMDRAGHQWGYRNFRPSGGGSLYDFRIGGDILRAAVNGNGDYILESGGTTINGGGCGANNQGPGGGEYYCGDAFHTGHFETTIGSLAHLPGSGEVLMTAMDPKIGYANGRIWTGGFLWLNNQSGSAPPGQSNPRGMNLYAGTIQGSFGKASGLGDVEVLCGLAPVQLGNYVWLDTNGDGIQDPCEEPVAGFTVKLYTKPASGDAQLAATTMTDADGEYYFTNNTTAGETWETGFTEVEPGAEYFVVFCGENYDAGSDMIQQGGEFYVPTKVDSGMGDNPDFNDSDATELTVTGVGDFPAVCVTADSVNHTIDLGLKLECGIVLDSIFLAYSSLADTAVIDLHWANGPTTGGFEYRFDSTGAWLPLARTDLSATGEEHFTIVLPLTSFKMINVRFADDPGCFLDIMFVFDLDDPAGFFYCERTGQILEGGSITVTAPEGGHWHYVTDENGNALDGTSGFYEWVVSGSPIVTGHYIMNVTPPPGMEASMTRVPGNPAYGDGDEFLDPTRGDADNPMSLDTIFLGSDVNADSTFLLDYTAAVNPFFLDFLLHPDDAYILNNHIPIKNCYCDLALVNKIDEIPSTLSVGDTVKYEVIVENQGDVDATNVDIKYTIPNGLSYLPVNDSGDPVWSEDTDCATTTITETIPGGESDTICIYLMLENVPTDEVTDESWTTYAEISAFEDPADPGVDKEDFDSTPDSDPTNDPGGNPDDDTDDETGGNGSGDPDDETEDMDPALDEDDHDPALIEICDAAAIINTNNEGPFQYNDTVKYNVVVFNQGNGDITNIVVNDFLGSGLEFITTTLNTASGWIGDSDEVTVTFTETIAPGESDTICLELQLVSVIPFDENAYVQTIEIESYEDPASPGDPKPDIDSTPNDDPTDDPGGNPGDDTDDETDGEGTGDPEDENDDMDPTMDEDDHDSDEIEVFDLAITKVVVDDRPYAPGEMVTFEMKVYNQGNVDAVSYELTDYLTDGFAFTTTGNPGWSEAGDNLLYTSSGTLAAGDTATVNLTLTVVIPAVVTGLSDWWNYVEISSVDDDTDSGNVDPIDADSTPDDVDNNDNPVEPDDDDDDEITENGNDGDDEDDHDPAAVIVGYDIALAKTVSPSGAYSYGDTLTYTIRLTNQGGLTMSNISVYDSLPCGLEFIVSENPDWDLNGAIATTTYVPQLASTETADLEMKVIVRRCDVPAYDNYYNVAEVSDFLDEDGNEPTTEDIDSTPDDNSGNDGDPINDAITDPMDEDDHDYEDIEICDVALINTIAALDEPVRVGDTVKYEVIVENQGNHDVNSVTIDYDIPNGFSYLPVNDVLTPAWSSSSIDDADLVTVDVIAPGERDTVCLYLQLENVSTDEVTEDSWTTIAEITEYTNENDEVKTTDADSTPDDDPTNDPGGNPDDDTDDETDGEGTGDPNDPTEDMDPTMDEDDHDPAIIYVCDVATIIDTEDEGPFSYGDTVKYEVIVYNQGNGDITNIDVQNLYGEGLQYVDNAGNTAEGWIDEADGELGLLITDVLAPGESDTTCLYMEIIPDYDSSEESWLQNVEVVSFEDPENPGDPKEDVDSTPDDDPTNDPGGNPNDPDTDDETDGDGSGDPNDPNENTDPELDEDDQDVEDIEICDIALINTIADLSTPVRVGDTVKYEVIVINQGNVGAESVDLYYYIPNGLTYLPVNDGLDPAWDEETVGELLNTTTAALVPGASDTLCLYLQLENVATDEVTEDSWTTIAEITEYTDENGDEKTFDVDSNPDSDPTNDPGGNPGDDTDDELEGDGTGDPKDPMEDMDPELDEDDHDPAIIYVCDVAVIIYDELPNEINYYDTLKYNVVVSNQGNGDITNIRIADHLPEGFELIETSSNTAEGWAGSTEISDAIEVVVTDTLSSGESDTICLELKIIPIHEGSNEESWLQEVEVVSFEDPAAPGDPKEDVDSTPDDDPTNDPGGNPDDDTDDETDGDGTGDPNDPNEDENPDLDEDDHDPVDTKVLDLALIIQIDSMPPVLPVVPGDELKFIIVVSNQGNTAVNDVLVSNYIMDQNLILSENVGNNGWDDITSETNQMTINDTILPGEKDTICVYLEVINGAMTDIVTYAEISGSEQTDDDCYDIDSTPDDDVTDDAGGEPDTPTDDHVEDDGEDSNEDGITDEDDHDPAMINGQDLALIIWADQKDPVQEGDDVKFIIRIINQGNIANTDITIADYLPVGFDLSENDTNGWAFANDSTLTKTLTDTLEMGDTIEICIVLEVLEGVSATDLINYAEIVSSFDIEGLNLTDLDIDSRPNMIDNDDIGGQYEDMPDCVTDPVVINDDNYVDGASFDGEDEDDHDPAWVPVFDLATIIYTDQTLPIIPGDEIKFNVEVHNQGNMAATDIDFNIYMPEGFTLSLNDDNGWFQDDDILDVTYEEELLPNGVDTICLILEVLPDNTLEDLIPVVEIVSVMDTLGNDRTDDDLDSRPNDIEFDDEGGEIFTDDDDELNENGDMGNDEDDHDPALPPVLDLAIKIVTIDESPKQVGDTVKFEVTLYNQGSLVPGEFTIEDYIPEGLTFFADLLNNGWIAKGDTSATYNYTDDLDPLSSDTLCIYLIMNEDANPLTVVNMVEITEVIDMEDRDVSALDIDSEADDSNENDKGNDLYSDEDNKLDENGRSGDDEDDHDQAFVNMCGELHARGEVNLSLDENCEGGIEASLLLIGDIFPNKLYTITVEDEHGNLHDPNVFTSYDLGKQFKVEICLPLCDNICAWSYVNIEDKFLPTISACVGDTISCVEDVDIAANKPVAEDNCSAELRLVGKTYNKINCDSLLLGEYILSWIAVDLAGNVSEDTCVQTVGVRRTDLDGVRFPKSLIGGSAVACGTFENYKLENGAPSPEFAGKPSLNGVILEPFESNDICGGYLEYQDEVIHDHDCKRAYSRTWQIIEWHCDTIVRKPFVQLIEVVDKEAPTVVAPKDMTVSVDGRNCTAIVDLPAAAISDNCNTYDVVINYGNGLPLTVNGGVVELTEGVNTIIYKATDKCNNVTRDTMSVLVRDGIEPIAICETYTTVSLQSDGEAWARSEDIDDGSFDDCSTPVQLEIRRMSNPCNPGDTLWTDRIGFCCDDVRTTDLPMVALRVTDNSGNTNICMVEVEVQDKNLPTITCPIADTVVTCDILYDPNNPATTFGKVAFTGTPCPGNLEVDDRFISEALDQCRIGELRRQIDVSFNGSVIKTCHQRIQVNTDNPIDGMTIEWPKDVTITNVCPDIGIDPDFMAADVAKPIVPDGGCNLVGIEKTDERYDFAGNGACFKIIRTWSVIDWCGRNQNGADTIPTWTKEQVIVVENTLKPVITSPDTTVSVTTFKNDCSTIPITLTASATDSCTPAAELQWDWIVTLEDGSEIRGLSNDASGTYPIGMHRVDFEVRDRCGNIEKTGYNFEIINGKAPTAYCKYGLSTALVGMDTSTMTPGVDAELAMITPELFDNGSFHVCDYPVQLSFSSDVDSTLAVLSCNNIGRNDIELWITDINGNQSFCKTFIDVIDTNDVDICVLRLADVAGRISTSGNLEIPNTVVQLIDNETTIRLTDEEGEYVFADMPLGGDYMVEPLKDDDDMNGVSTLDLILIQRHILGIKEFVDPYTMIAADVNHDDRVSTADLVGLRKLVLGVYDEFPDNTSWRFVDENHIFPIANDPWAEYIKEDYEINYLNEDMYINFIGVKIGDVNGSVDPGVRSGNISPRSNKNITLEMTNRSIESGEEIHLGVRIAEDTDLKGLQLALDLDGLILKNIIEGALEINRSNTLYTDQVGMRISYDHVDKEGVLGATKLFTLVMTAEASGYLEDMITINENHFAAEGYFGNNVEVADVTIDWRKDHNTEKFDFAVSQNEPNPWLNETMIEVVIPNKGEVSLSVMDISGKLLYSKSRVLEQGKHVLRLNKTEIPSTGVLFYEVEYDGQLVSKKMLAIE